MLFRNILIVLFFLILVILAILPGYTPHIKNTDGTNKSIAELAKITIGSSEQWIMIRSENINNPVILFVHGGPGTSQLTLMKNNTRSLEKYFTIVNWDQRGAGKSYPAIQDTSRMNIDQFVADVNELSEYLAKRFNKNKIILAGHSWGSAISVLAAAQRPDLYSAYIGIGQIANMLEGEKISYEWTLQQATAANDVKAVQKLTDIGYPPYTGVLRKKVVTQRHILGTYGGECYGSKMGAFKPVIKNLVFSTEYTFMDRINFFKGIFGSMDILWPQLMTVNLFEQAPELKIPVWFMLGRHDYEVPSALSARYFEALQAPQKTLYWFENSAHMPNTEEKELFNQILVEMILPAIEQSQIRTITN